MRSLSGGANCGSINPMSLDETARSRGTYRGAFHALAQMSADEVIDEVLNLGLRGRRAAATSHRTKVAPGPASRGRRQVCGLQCRRRRTRLIYRWNSILEGDPHAIIEGMLIGSYAIAQLQGLIYVRDEYPLAMEILQHAPITEAEQAGILGDNIFGSGSCVPHKCAPRGRGLHLRRRNRAYRIAGRPFGRTRAARPPYPVTNGLWGKPTVVNNVKTWASVAPIITRGTEWYASMGTKRTPGTTIFSLEGAVKNAGLVEVPFGITLRELVYDIGGGVIGDRPLKALQAGGTRAAAFLPACSIYL